MPILHCRCMGLHGADVERCSPEHPSGEAPGVILGSLKRDWLQIDVAAIGDAPVARLSVLGWESLYNSNPRKTATQLVLDLDCHQMLETAQLTCCCQMLATVAAKHSIVGYSRSRSLNLNVVANMFCLFRVK